MTIPVPNCVSNQPISAKVQNGNLKLERVQSQAEVAESTGVAQSVRLQCLGKLFHPS